MNAEHSNAITISAGHNEPCHLCGELCDGLAGNPGKWPIMLPVEGAPKWHHTGCVAARIAELHEALKEARGMIEDWASYADEYFQVKWDLAGDLAKIDAVLAAKKDGS